MTTANVGPAKAQLKGRMEALLTEYPTGTMPSAQQAEFDSLVSAARILDQVGAVTMLGIDMANVSIGPDGTLLNRRRADTSDVYERGRERQAAEAAQQPPRQRRGHRAADIFAQAAPKSEYGSLEHFAWNIAQGNRAVMAASGASEGVPSDGGFLIPPEFVFDILDKSVEDEIVRPRCRVEGMKSDSKTIATYDDSSHAGGELFGGLQLQWIPEGGTIDFQVAKTRQIILHAKKAVIMAPATNEMLADAPNYANGLTARMTTALGFGLDRACLISGTGGGQPLSVLNATSTITAAKEGSQAADTIVYANLTSMMARMHPACFSNSVWVVHPSAIPQLLTLSIAIGTAGAHVPVMTGDNGAFTILTRPVIFSEKMNPVGDLGDILLVDLSQYVMGVQQNGFRLDQSSHLLFKTDETVWRLVVRIDGQPTWAQAFQPLNSAPTLSWAVTLQAR